jgi:single-stranded DNA-binding protein
VSYVLVSGKIFRPPEARTSKAGKEYATCTIKEGQGEHVVWWSVAAFGDRAHELLRLHDADPISVSGQLTVETYEKAGEIRLQFKVIADQIASPRLSQRERHAVPSRREPAEAAI